MRLRDMQYIGFKHQRDGAEYNNIEFGFASFNIVVLCPIKPHIDLVQVQ
jgi:hypothetical protein